MPELRLRLTKSGSCSPRDDSSRPSQDLRTPRHVGGGESSSAAVKEWNRKRGLKLKASPPTNIGISTKLKTSPPTIGSISSSSSYDSNGYEHHYLTPLKISPSHTESPPQLQYVDHAQHGKVSPKSALFIFIILTSFTVGTIVNWKEGSYYEGHPRCAVFETMPQNSSPPSNRAEFIIVFFFITLQMSDGKLW